MVNFTSISVPEFQEMINNVENINIGPQSGKRETTAGALKRPEKRFQNKAHAKSTKVLTNSI